MTALDRKLSRSRDICPRQHRTCCPCSPNDSSSLLHALSAPSLCLELNSQHKEIGQCLLADGTQHTVLWLSVGSAQCMEAVLHNAY